MIDNKENETRYKFGKNWASYSESIDDAALNNAKDNLRLLVGSVEGKSFLDIGSGSGIHALASLQMGSKFIEAIDYDLDSVATTEKVLKKYANNTNWSVHFGDIVTLNGIKSNKFDVVYSWGVLHHTGDMWAAIDNAIEFVDDNGKFVVALYVETYLCWFWKVEKYFYNKLGFFKPFIKYPFSFLLIMAMAIKNKKKPTVILNEYVKKRGMSFFHDVDDWLGGYPYESVKPDFLVSYIESKGFKMTLANCKTPKIGVFGSGCGEWVFEKI
jgi:2-polyprenyl-6-hydroxyphenyl methylase/3-demethylubiquinone-9 3-methyltransferase